MSDPNNPAAAVRPRILLVEDDAALGAALKFKLEVEGYDVELLDRAEPLLTRPFPETPVCLVVDLNLPGMTGLEALEALRRRGVTAPAILITTQPKRVVRTLARALGVQVVEKPILGERLSDVIRACVVG